MISESEEQQGWLFRDTLSEAIERVRSERRNGLNCPCCGQYAKEYKRKLNTGMVQALIKLWRLTVSQPDEVWFHIRFFVSQTGSNRDYSILQHWNLIESRGDEGDNTPSAGYWKITTRGTEFLLDETYEPKHVFLYNDEFSGFGDEYTTAREALGDRFNFDELMQA
jgi:hypothetical protein